MCNISIFSLPNSVDHLPHPAPPSFLPYLPPSALSPPRSRSSASPSPSATFPPHPAAAPPPSATYHPAHLPPPNLQPCPFLSTWAPPDPSVPPHPAPLSPPWSDLAPPLPLSLSLFLSFIPRSTLAWWLGFWRREKGHNPAFPRREKIVWGLLIMATGDRNSGFRSLVPSVCGWLPLPVVASYQQPWQQHG